VEIVSLHLRIGRGNDSEREAWVRARLSEIPPNSRLLDIGAGELRFKPACAHLRYVSQDFGRYDGTGDGQGLQTGSFDQSGIDLVCDAMEIPEPDGSFNAILCTEVIEHLADPIGALREMARLLRPAGTLILTAPFVSFTHFSPYHFHTGFSRYWYEHWLPRQGFRILRLEPQAQDGFFDFMAQEIGRIPDVWQRYGRVGARGRAFVGIALKAFVVPARVLLAVLHRWSRPSTDFCTYRWCCVAERI